MRAAAAVHSHWHSAPRRPRRCCCVLPPRFAAVIPTARRERLLKRIRQFAQRILHGLETGKHDKLHVYKVPYNRSANLDNTFRGSLYARHRPCQSSCMGNYILKLFVLSGR